MAVTAKLPDISRQTIVELIRLAPDIGAGAGDLVLPRGGVELRGPFEGRSADVVGIGEGAELPGLSEGRNGQQASEQQFTHVKIVSERRDDGPLIWR